MRCRLLYLVGQLGPGGLERQFYYLLQGMDRDRYRPEVVVWNFRDDDTYVPLIQRLDVSLHSFPDTLGAAGKLLAFRRMVVRMRPEVVHSCSFYTNFAAWWAALGTNSVAIGAVRSDFNADKQSCGFLLGSLSARWPRTQIFNSFTAAKNARHARGLFVSKSIVVVRNGIDLAEFPTVPLSLNGQVRILGVGSLRQLKRWDRLLTAASSLKKNGLDFHVEIAGEGPLSESLLKEIQELELGDRVRLSGYTTDIPDFLSKSTFLVHTSDVEGCPNVVMEAMACGRPVLATDAGDIPSLVDDGKTGFVVRRGDDAKFLKRLLTLITDRNLCRQMGEAGRAKAEREFGLNRMISETFAAYRATGWENC